MEQIGTLVIYIGVMIGPERHKKVCVLRHFGVTLNQAEREARGFAKANDSLTNVISR